MVGFGWLEPEAGEYLSGVEGEVGAVYVHPSVARRGVGSRLYAELERRARRVGVGSLGLWASPNATGFYAAQGFERVTEHVNEFSDGVEGTVVEMRKDLDVQGD